MKGEPEQHIREAALHLAIAARIYVDNGTLAPGMCYRVSYDVLVTHGEITVQYITAEQVAGAVQ